ncbi:MULTISPECIES: DMT family transporter [unclassified Bosea (in: a-proteobacteria)]|uniref:DMT family transporter n=1 Tax=unclassified Bosea (in: a-proteobacteria) TaxID=2653178 RepID=UPI00095457A0|nr:MULTISPECIES: DMT family transporter [unclassified Bosea (in: a-proteobacteria)]SIQ03599.1 S-adenosylmethionine uptake transporter [Bosea sp. TND4EK4]
MSISTALRAALGIALLTAMDAVIKGQMQQHGFLLALFMRFVMGGATALIVLAIVRPPRPTRASLIGNLARVPLVVMTAGSFFYSISVLPLAEALTLSFLAPVFVALLGGLLLKERIDRRVLQALGFGLAGMLVMVWPRLQGHVGGAGLGVAAALFSAVSYAFNLILLRRIATREHPTVIVAFQAVGPALVLAIPALQVLQPMSWTDLALYAAAGVLGVSGHLMLTSAYARAAASKLAAIEYTALIWASLLGFFFFAEVPLYTTLAGAVLIVAGAVAVSRR